MTPDICATLALAPLLGIGLLVILGALIDQTWGPE